MYTIKPLDFKPHAFLKCYTAHVPGGQYQIWPDMQDKGKHSWSASFVPSSATPAANFNEAKAACNAHWVQQLCGGVLEKQMCNACKSEDEKVEYCLCWGCYCAGIVVTSFRRYLKPSKL